MEKTNSIEFDKTGQIVFIDNPALLELISGGCDDGVCDGGSSCTDPNHINVGVLCGTQLNIGSCK